MDSPWLDVSIPIRGAMIAWPEDPPVEVEEASSFENGDEVSVRRLGLGSHTGTHVDAPAHYLRGGATLDELALDAVLGPARVVHLDSPRAVSAEDLMRAEIAPSARVLLRTRNSDRRWYDEPFRQDYVHLELEAARLLAQRRVRLVGVDYLSVGGFAPAQAGAEVHRLLLGAGVWILEGLYLGAVEPGPYWLAPLPLRLERGDGAPARAVLRRME